MDYTENLNLNKPAKSEQYNLDHWNENSDIIDAAIHDEITRAEGVEADLQAQIDQNRNEERRIGTVPIAKGGTGSTTAQDALNALHDSVETQNEIDEDDEFTFIRKTPEDISLGVEASIDVESVKLKNLAQKVYLFTLPSFLAPKPRFLRFVQGAKKALKIIRGTYIRVSGHLFHAETDTIFDLSEQNLEAGKDYFVYLEWAAGDNWTLRASLTKVADTSTSRYIGRFHTLCVAVGANTTMKMSINDTAQGDSVLIKPYSDDDADFKAFYTKTVTTRTVGTRASGIVQGPFYDIATVAHPLAGFSEGDILPESVWCLTFKPNSRFDDGMVYDKATDKAIDIYLQSGAGANTRSLFNAVHTVSRPQIVHQDDMLQVGKELLNDTEFSSASLGSNEKTSIQGNSDKSTVGGHVDTANRRMTSAIGCEECCGYLWQWTRDVAPLGTGAAWTNIDDTNGHNVGNSGWISEDGQNDFGEMYNCVSGLLAGGAWNDGAHCGSRSRAAAYAQSSCHAAFGCRGSSRVVTR